MPKERKDLPKFEVKCYDIVKLLDSFIEDPSRMNDRKAWNGFKEFIDYLGQISSDLKIEYEYDELNEVKKDIARLRVERNELRKAGLFQDALRIQSVIQDNYDNSIQIIKEIQESVAGIQKSTLIEEEQVSGIGHPGKMEDLTQEIGKPALASAEVEDLGIKKPVSQKRKKISFSKSFKKIFDYAQSPYGLGLTTNQATEFAKKWMLESDEEFERFKEIYEYAHRSDGLGLSGREARKFAEKWITETVIAFERWKNVYGYAKDELNLILEKRIEFANEWNLKSDEEFEKFKQTYAYARSSKGLGLSRSEATEFAKKWVGEPDEEFEKFKQTYAYARSSKGLGLSRIKINRKLLAAIVIFIVVVAGSVASWQLFVKPEPPSPEPLPGEGKAVGLILSTEGLGDKSFNDVSYAGLVRANENLGVDIAFVEPASIAEYEAYQRDFAREGGFELIICVGYSDQADALTVVSQEFADQKFAIIDIVVEQPNVACLFFKSNEASFLVGVAAGMMTETGNLGFVGGMDIDLIHNFFLGYKAGVNWVNADATVLEPVYVGDWDDPAKAKEMAKSLVDSGADGIFAPAGKSGLGALDCVVEEGIMGFGVDACQCYLSIDNIPLSMTKRVDVAVYEIIEAAIEGTFKGGIYNKGLADEWVGICRLPEEAGFWEETFEFTHPPLDTEVQNRIQEARTKIISGEIIVPTA